MFQHFQTGVSFYFPLEAYIFWEFLFGDFLFFGLGVCAVSRLSVPWFFGQVLASCFPWLLGFSVSGLLCHSTSYSFLVLYGLLASWLPWLLGFSASRLVGLSTSYSFVYYIILCYITLYYVILNYINIYIYR